jgi:AraC family transcriptional regulator
MPKIGSEEAEAPVCPQNRAYGSVHGSSRKAYPLTYIGDNLADDLSLSQLAAVAGMRPHYFAELFKQSTGRAPHQYVLLQRIERAKQSLCVPGRSVIDAGLDAGFQNPSHFARVFRKFWGISPSGFRLEMLSGR